ncbi:MAG: alanine dehydrogenase [Prevotellaceae bacterium]|jgi:alanine dehydrogenase|nr:alanine dehydrogenase [Prevotellaceae bacterium]
MTSQNKFYPEECLLPETATQQHLIIGIPREDAALETRLALTPEGVSIVVEEGHTVLVERGAGESMNYSDLQYSEAGATIVDSSEEVFAANILLKIAPPTFAEISLMKAHTTLLSMLQISTLSAESIRLMMKKKITAVAYELLKDEQKNFPVVSSISEIEGISAISVAMELMSNERGGKGLLLGGVPGVPPSEVVILGAGISGIVAARTALALGATVKIFDHDIAKLRQIHSRLGQHVFTSVIHPVVLIRALSTADAVIANLRYINDSERFMVSEELVKKMKRGAVIVDLSVDQGGCFETSECRTLKNPVFEQFDITHYCVPNISARVARTSSMVLSNIFAPLLLKIANAGGIDSTINEDYGFRNGVYLYEGILVNYLVGTHYKLPANDLGLLLV